MKTYIKLNNGHTAEIIFDWGNGVIQFAYTDSEGTIKIIRGKRSDWEA